jgi:hypothetical protein
MIIDGKLSEITSPEEAFLIGYLSGDATFRVSKRKLANGECSLHPRLYISDSCDLDILQWIEKNFPTTGIKTRERVIRGKNRVLHTIYFPILFMSSLEKFGLFFSKKERKLYDLDDSLFIYYLQGLTLADGCIYIRHRKDCRTPRLNYCIAHQSQELFDILKFKLNTKYDYPIQIRKVSNQNVIYLDCQHTEENKKFLKILFLDHTCPVENKKVKSFKEYLKEYPEGISKEVASKFK